MISSQPPKELDTPDGAGILDAERKILRSRAAALAVKPVTSNQLATTEVVSFLLGDAKYAFERRMVREIIPLKNINLLPGTPLFVEGILNLRGQLVTVISLKQFLNLDQSIGQNRHCQKAIIIEAENMKVAFAVHNILSVMSISLASLTDSLSGFDSQRVRYAKGIINDLIVLDLEKIMTDKKLIVEDKVTI